MGKRRDAKMLDDVQKRYSKGAMAFHWIIAVLVIVNWRLAETAHHMESGAGWYWSQHKAVGITILVLTVGRLLWRLGHPVPRLPDAIPSWQRVASRSLHALFYALLIGLPLGAWIANSLGDHPVDFFGLFTIPPLPVGTNEGMAETIFGIHATGAEIFIYLIGIHILAALYHTFRKDGAGLGRMLPLGRS